MALILFKALTVLSCSSILPSSQIEQVLCDTGILCGFRQQALIRTSKSTFTISAGYCLFFSSEEKFQLLSNQATPLYLISIKINHIDFINKMNGLFERLQCSGELVDSAFLCSEARLDAFPVLENRVNTLLSSYLQQSVDQRTLFSSDLYDSFLEDIGTSANHPFLDATTKLDIQYVPKNIQKIYTDVISFIDDNIQSDISVAQLAYIANCSTKKLNNVFRKYSYCTATEFVAQRRLEFAKQLLRNPTLTITEISFLTGFNSLHYFSRLFKKKYNVSPQTYRNSL